ncbi:MAG TPA: hypothetical protein VN654_12325 [Vicinamibacterales bacterium]|nr:hypothetical protein [Vicinamibacterales bacterium]
MDSLIKDGEFIREQRLHRRAADPVLREETSPTPFPSSPEEVVPLSIDEFASDVRMEEPLSIDMVCSRFTDDLNRALVWILRYRALTALAARAEIAAWLTHGARSWRDMFEVAAEFPLNSDWGFDGETFCAAVDATASRRGDGRGGVNDR